MKNVVITRLDEHLFFSITHYPDITNISGEGTLIKPNNPHYAVMLFIAVSVRNNKFKKAF